MDLQQHISICYFKTPVGELILGSYNNKLVIADWRYRKMRERIDKRIQEGLKANYLEKTSETLMNTKDQLSEYFAGTRQIFDIPLQFIGTEFQQDVWDHLSQIPFGKTMSYKQLSEQMNNPLGIRAIASANGANSISIIVPCHRIIGSSGELVGYAGGLPAKKKLLQLEGTFTQMQMF